MYSPGDNDRPDLTRDLRRIIYPKNKEVTPGPDTVFASIGAVWANVANSPFRYWKARMYEGGICTPMIAYWPKGIKKNKSGITTEMGHVMDIMATCVDLAKTRYPMEYNTNKIIPMEGLSLVPFFKTGKRNGHDYIGFEHFNEKVYRSKDGWKIIKGGDIGSEWQLYNLKNDRTELHDLAKQYPEKVAEMAGLYNAWAKRCLVEPAPK